MGKEKVESDEIQPTFEEIKVHPENYLQVFVITRKRIVKTNYVLAKNKEFSLQDDSTTYKVDPDRTYLLPRSTGGIIPTSFYKEGKCDPIEIRNKNKGIPANALTLLWNPALYKPLVKFDDKKYSIIVIGLILASIVMYAGTLYFLFVHNGGIL